MSKKSEGSILQSSQKVRREILQENTSNLQALMANTARVACSHEWVWQPARPEPSPYPWASFKRRLRGAWLVFTGKAQFIRWYK